MSYVHKKTGKLYDILAVALDATNGRDDETVVIYWRKTWFSRLIRELLASQLVFVRDRREFKEKFRHTEGV